MLNSIFIQTTLTSLRQQGAFIPTELHQSLKEIFQRLTPEEICCAITPSELRDLKERVEALHDKTPLSSQVCTARKITGLFERLQLSEALIQLPPKEIKKLLSLTQDGLAAFKDLESKKAVLNILANQPRGSREQVFDQLCQTVPLFVSGSKEILLAFCNVDPVKLSFLLTFFCQFPVIGEDSQGAICFIKNIEHLLPRKPHTLLNHLTGFLQATSFYIPTYMQLCSLCKKFAAMPAEYWVILSTHQQKIGSYTKDLPIGWVIVNLSSVAESAFDLHQLVVKSLQWVEISKDPSHFVSFLTLFSYLPPPLWTLAEKMLSCDLHAGKPFNPYLSIEKIYQEDPYVLRFTHKHILHKLSTFPSLFTFQIFILLQNPNFFGLFSNTHLFYAISPYHQLFKAVGEKSVMPAEEVHKVHRLMMQGLYDKKIAKSFYQAYQSSLNLGPVNTLVLSIAMASPLTRLEELTEILDVVNLLHSYIHPEVAFHIKKLFPEQASECIPFSLKASSLLSSTSGLGDIVSTVLSISTVKDPPRIQDIFLILCLFNGAHLPRLKLLIESVLEDILSITYSWPQLLQAILAADETLSPWLHSHLLHQLHTNSFYYTANFIAVLITSSAHSFLLTERDPLFIHALSALDHTRNFESLWNPYVIHESHIHFHKSCFSLIDCPSFDAVVQGQRYQKTFFSLTKSPQLPLQLSDLTLQLGERLPSAEDLQHELNGLKKRYEEMACADQEVLAASVKDTFDATLDELLENLSDDFLMRLLTLHTTQPVPLVSAYFVSIVAHALSLPTHRDGTLLSDREYCLLSYSKSIQACSAGKTEGIVLTYPLLPDPFRYPIDSCLLTPCQGKAKSWVLHTVKKHLMDTISSPSPFMKRITGYEDAEEREIPQLAHHSLFLKNILGPIFHLNHQVTFDFYTPTLSITLLERSAEEIVHDFISDINIDTLVEVMQRSFAKGLSGTSLYTGITEVLASQMPLEDLWLLDETTFEPTLSKRGALALLTHFELITRID